jgi:GNAT superfamily N-acetyltransferase
MPANPFGPSLSTKLTIRPYCEADQQSLWQVLEPVFRAGDTYTVSPDISKKAAIDYWTIGKTAVFVVQDPVAKLLGTYFLKTNQGGGGSHVCNCGFVTAAPVSGKGIARLMLTHAISTATDAGYRAMQFNFVVAGNTRAIATWERAGFETVGWLPDAFKHPTDGFVDALVMYKSLAVPD